MRWRDFEGEVPLVLLGGRGGRAAVDAGGGRGGVADFLSAFAGFIAHRFF